MATAATPPQAERLLEGIASNLGVSVENVLPAYEDPAHWLFKEGALPVNVDALDPKMEEAEERSRMVRAFERGLTKPVGYVLPIQPWNAQAREWKWKSERWQLRRGKLFLMPGDSPVGLRLPLGSLPWMPPMDYPYVHPQDPLEQRPPLPTREELEKLHTQPRAPGPRTPGPPPVGAADVGGYVRTALTIEPRNGILCVFMPPVERLEDYLALIATIERTAHEIGAKVHIEGYPPPYDPRLDMIKVTPDPGVIEVNIHPASSWRQAVATTTAVYDDARQSRLGTDKYMIDGRHVGTGGGNHVVLGGSAPADSPFLRRPDLLKSLIVYWQRHPSLSYLFSGLFIGPTSQSPRIDEARHDSLYEMEIALSQVPGPNGGTIPLWLVDRLFRNSVDRRHRQHPSRGNLHRQALLAGRPHRPARPDRIPFVRDAAGRAHESRAAAVAARAGRVVLARAATGQAGAMGHGLARPLHAAAFRLAGFSRSARRSVAAQATRSIRSGSRRSASSGFRSTDRCSMAA